MLQHFPDKKLIRKLLVIGHGKEEEIRIIAESFDEFQAILIISLKLKQEAGQQQKLI